MKSCKELKIPSKLDYVNTVKRNHRDLLKDTELRNSRTFIIVTLQPAKKYILLFTAFKFNKPSANNDIQRQECHSSLNSLVKMVNPKLFLRSVLPFENLSIFFCFPVLVSTMLSPESL